MQNESDAGKEDDVSLPAIVKPEPRTPVTTGTPVNLLKSVSIAMSPITPTEPVDVLAPSVTTSTPATSQGSDSPSKKKGVSLSFSPKEAMKNKVCLLTDT